MSTDTCECVYTREPRVTHSMQIKHNLSTGEEETDRQIDVATVTPQHTETTDHRDLELFESRYPMQNNETWGISSHI